MRRLYTLLLTLAMPVVALLIAVRAWRERAPQTGWRERLGGGAARTGGGIWVHAVSVGEVQVAALLLEALRASDPALELTLSCATPSAHARARALLPAVGVRYAPYDLPVCVRACLRRLRPSLAVLIEGELWPNLLHELRAAGVPTVLASARLSARSARRWGHFPSLLQPLRDNVWVGAQSEPDAQRYRALGVPAERTRVLGNLKFDRSVPPGLRERGAALRARYAASRPVWVAGSVHPGELQVVLEAHRLLRERLPSALLVLAPRHAFRFEEAAAAVAQAGFACVRRSSQAVPATTPVPAVLLLDTLGELVDFYAAADAAFVGGSLVPVGGHNLLEPAVLGLPVLSGPQHTSSPQVAAILAAAGALTTVRDAPSLAAALAALLADAVARARQGERASAALAAHRGALQGLLQWVQGLRAGKGLPARAAAAALPPGQ